MFACIENLTNFTAMKRIECANMFFNRLKLRKVRTVFKTWKDNSQKRVQTRFLLVQMEIISARHVQFDYFLRWKRK